MSVKSARVQEIIKGDDSVLRHVVIGPKAIGNNETLGLIDITDGEGGDVVRAFYPQEDGSTVFSAVGVPVSGQPSTYDFSLSQAQTILLAAGQGQTVRIEVTRASGKLDTHYLYRELDVLARSFPAEENPLSLP